MFILIQFSHILAICPAESVHRQAVGCAGCYTCTPKPSTLLSTTLPHIW